MKKLKEILIIIGLIILVYCCAWKVVDLDKQNYNNELNSLPTYEKVENDIKTKYLIEVTVYDVEKSNTSAIYTMFYEGNIKHALYKLNTYSGYILLPSYVWELEDFYG